MNKSIVVLANPKSILNTRYAKKEDKDKVIRVDQLVSYIKKMYADSKELELSDTRLLKWANSYLDLHKEVEKDYTVKYQQYMTKVNVSQGIGLEELEQKQKTEAVAAAQAEVVFKEPVTEAIFEDLRQYRLEKSREEGIKPYVIYSNKQLEDLIQAMPTTLDQLAKVKGFGELRIKRYGPDLIQILQKHTN